MQKIKRCCNSEGAEAHSLIRKDYSAIISSQPSVEAGSAATFCCWLGKDDSKTANPAPGDITDRAARWNIASWRTPSTEH
jgi:hypothetical protein